MCQLPAERQGLAISKVSRILSASPSLTQSLPGMFLTRKTGRKAATFPSLMGIIEKYVCTKWYSFYFVLTSKLIFVHWGESKKMHQIEKTEKSFLILSMLPEHLKLSPYFYFMCTSVCLPSPHAYLCLRRPEEGNGPLEVDVCEQRCRSWESG